METLRLKNINMLKREQFENLEELAGDELYAVTESGFGFPSSRYEDLELGASGTQYTAPANGWFFLSKVCGITDGYIAFTNNTKGYEKISCISPSSYYARDIFPVQKEDIIQIDYNASGAIKYFRFIYAEGE